MTTRWFELASEQGIAHLKFCRPESLNAMTPDFLHALKRTVQELDTAGHTRVLVISSTGRHFSAGMELSEFSPGNGLPDVDSPRGRLELQTLIRELSSCFEVLDAARFPVIAAIQGGCIGGGMDLIAACDLRCCTRDAFFCVQEINIGMVADLGTLQRLPKLIPAGIVREYAYTGRRMPAARAHELGLVNEVYEDQPAMLASVQELAREIVAHSPLAIAGSKLALNHARDHSTSESLAHVAVLQSAILSPAEIQASIRAMREKKAAAFDDLAARTGSGHDTH